MKLLFSFSGLLLVVSIWGCASQKPEPEIACSGFKRLAVRSARRVANCKDITRELAPRD